MLAFLSMIERFIYPPRCIHCAQSQKKQTLLCVHCLRHIDFRPITEPSCASYKSTACFERHSPIYSLEPLIDHPAVAKLCASLMVVYLDRLGWDLPEGIHHILRKGQPLAYYLSRALGVKRMRKISDRHILIPTIWPLAPKVKSFLYEFYPSKIYNIALFESFETK